MKKIMAFLLMGVLLLGGCHQPSQGTAEEALSFRFFPMESVGKSILSAPLLIQNAEECQAFEETYGLYLSEDARYSAEFFEESVLVLVEETAPSIPQFFWIEKVEKEGREITFCCVQGAPVSGDDAFGHALMRVELSKFDAEGCQFRTEVREQVVSLAY